jgi:hypothetical protein
MNMRDVARKAGVSSATVSRVVTNQPVDIVSGSLPELPTVVNFGTGGAKAAFQKLAWLPIDISDDTFTITWRDSWDLSVFNDRSNFH